MLGTTKLVKGSNTIPRDLVEGTESAKIAEIPKKAMRTAIRQFETGEYDSAAVRCRVTIEGALEDNGVRQKNPSTMVEEAYRDRLLIEPYEKYAQIVVAAGGKSAHPRLPIDRSTALICIALTAALLRYLYEVPT